MKSNEFKGSLSVLWLTLMSFLLLSWASKPDILGKWREVGKTATLEFSGDGTFKAVDNQGMSVSGQYTLSKDGKLMCLLTSGVYWLSYEFGAIVENLTFLYIFWLSWTYMQL